MITVTNRCIDYILELIQTGSRSERGEMAELVFSPVASSSFEASRLKSSACFINSWSAFSNLGNRVILLGPQQSISHMIEKKNGRTECSSSRDLQEFQVSPLEHAACGIIRDFIGLNEFRYQV